jgi:hypothetical protein
MGSQCSELGHQKGTSIPANAPVHKENRPAFANEYAETGNAQDNQGRGEQQQAYYDVEASLGPTVEVS